MDQRRREDNPAWQGPGETRIERLGGFIGAEEYPSGRKCGNDDAANALIESAEDIAGGLVDRRRAREGLEVVLTLPPGFNGVKRVDE